ncbi:unnamed protein product [Rotaria magnacalcarata]|uniref:Uncharacterized protein n=2 Tax=Rotaria magnacalcarata TaxID=392030 RepID=A0A815YFA3_9BILA|nr:unnamed protein product [Rotaria magnacalcarata]
MVKVGKKTTIRNSSDKNKENAVMFLLVRDIVSHTHHIVPRSTAITSKKIEKLEAGDEVSFGIRNKRSRCVILMIGSESQCKKSLVIIEKVGVSKKNSKTHEKKPIEDDSDVDSTNNGEAHESTEADSEEEASSNQENEVLRINEEQSSNVIHSLNSSSSSSSQSAIPKETESDKFAQKRKVPLEDDCSESATKCARNSYKGVSGSVHDALQRKVDSLDAQLLEYQTSWMPRPTDKATIDYFIDIGRVLSGAAERTNDDKSDLLTNMMDALDLTEQQLEKYIGKNIRITARRIMKAKYPSPVIGFKFADVDKDHISAARGVWSGSKKPTRTEMSLFLRPLIDELLNLERGEHFDFHDQDNNAITARIFLIGSCCDKPAQALLQFLPEPIAAFGYGRYEVKGFMVKTVKDGNVQSFATTCADLMEIQKRSNMRLCTRSYATNKIADDSNIIFLLDGIEYPGRVRAIFTLDNDEPYLLVAYLRDLNPLTCAINVSENFAYPNILYTSTSKQNFTPIEVKDFIEKSTFFRSTADISYFLRFPTLEHCS